MAEEDGAMYRVTGHMRQVAPLVLPASLASIHACLWREALRGSVHRRSIALRHPTIRLAPTVLKAPGHASLNVLPGLSGAAPAHGHKRIGHIDDFVRLSKHVLTIPLSNRSGGVAGFVASAAGRILPAMLSSQGYQDFRTAQNPYGGAQAGERWALWYIGY